MGNYKKTTCEFPMDLFPNYERANGYIYYNVNKGRKLQIRLKFHSNPVSLRLNALRSLCSSYSYLKRKASFCRER